LFCIFSPAADPAPRVHVRSSVVKRPSRPFGAEPEAPSFASSEKALRRVPAERRHALQKEQHLCFVRPVTTLGLFCTFCELPAAVRTRHFPSPGLRVAAGAHAGFVWQISISDGIAGISPQADGAAGTPPGIRVRDAALRDGAKSLAPSERVCERRRRGRQELRANRCCRDHERSARGELNCAALSGLRKVSNWRREK
jgi:hypothetical protein